jgi:hypothetical protein
MTLNLPGRDGRQWWQPPRGRGGEGGWERSVDDGKTKPSDVAGYGFSAFSCHSYPLWISSDEPAIIGQIAMNELELLNAPLSGRQAESQVVLRTVGNEGPRTLIQAVVIPSELETPPPHKAVRLQHFFPACFAFPFPRNSVVLWRESQRWVVGFCRSGKLVHFQGFGRGPLDDNAAGEIHCLLADLESRQQISTPESVVVWTEDGDDLESVETQAKLVGDRLKLPVESRPHPAPVVSLTADVDCVPEAVVRQREEQRSRAKTTAIANAVAFVYVLAVAAAVTSLYLKQRSNKILAQTVADRAPAAAAVRDARNRWETMHNALEVDSYPVELFHRVASLLPPKGVRLTHFEIRGQQIIIRGEASNIPKAIKFKADLENSPDLKDYEWRQTQPQIEGDTATFAAYGNHRFPKPAVATDAASSTQPAARPRSPAS